MAVLQGEMRELVAERALEKKSKAAKFISFERDLKIMYMKAVFNCYNELIIETKSSWTFMNGRSSIGPGELTLALKEYNYTSEEQQSLEVMEEAKCKVFALLRGKCVIAEFRDHREV